MLTEREQSTLQFIQEYIARHRKAPLLTEIAAGLGIQSKGVVHRYLSTLEEQGLHTPAPKASWHRIGRPSRFLSLIHI